ncbi:hypothetical protein B7486_11255 [cyanobacterium TDX16]|nr:hypothetical protein B7486_11255 [cyanobacterium TDX16]
MSDPTQPEQQYMPRLIAAEWYVPARRKYSRGWLVYTHDFILATLQGKVADPDRISHSTGWMIVGMLARGLMAIAQACIMVLAWIPITSCFLETIARVFSRNALGFFLRACYWKAKLGYLGQDTIIDQNVEIWGPAAVSIGSRCHIDTSVRLAAGERRHRQKGSIKIGNHVHLGPGVHIAGRGTVVIKDYVGVSAMAHLYSATNTIELPEDPGQLISMSHRAPPDQQFVIEKPIVIEEYAFLGMMSRIMPGVRIGKGAVIHSSTEIWKSVPPFANVAGPGRAKQIGWRRPRRASPNLPINSALNDFDPFWKEPRQTRGYPVIREVSSADDVATIAQVVDLHMDAFPHGITTQLGRHFVFEYYVAMITSLGASLWVAELDGKVCGFLGCAADRKLFEKAHRSGVVRFQALWRFITFRLNPFAIIRALKKKRLSKKFREPAELLSIVVSPELRRAGVGRRFLKVWSEKMAANKVDSYIVFTDNPEGLSFYEKYGGQCLFKFFLRGDWSACYRFDANTIESGEFDRKKEQNRPDGDIVDAGLRGEPDSACGSGNG